MSEPTFEAAIVEHDGIDWIGIGEAGHQYPHMGKVHALCGPVGGKYEAESIADARLFAASRDLLAACKKALEWFGEGADEYHILTAAIAKAEPKQ
jgi:hypothetical protein